MTRRPADQETTDNGRRVTRNMQRAIRFAGRLIALLCLLLPAAAAAQEREVPLVIPAGQTHVGDVATITRDILVDGTVVGDVTSWSGAIVVSGRVEGDVVSYSGQVTIQAGAHIGGHVLASGGALQLDAGAAVAGQTIRGDSGGVALANLLDLFSPAGSSGGEAAVGRVLFGVALGVFILAFTLLCIAFWPRRTATASLMLRRAPGRSLALGLLTTLLLVLALPPLAALLAATVIGLPLLIVLLVLMQAPYIYGLATLLRASAAPVLPTASLAEGEEQQRALRRNGEGPSRATLMIGAALVLLVVIGAALAPLWGLVLFYLLASPGLGAALLSRGGLLVPAYE